MLPTNATEDPRPANPQMSEATEIPPIKLHCLDGEGPSPEIVGGWRQYLALPKAARENIWDALLPVIVAPFGKEQGRLIGEFVASHDVPDAETLMGALRCLCTLVRQAVARNLDRLVFEQDLRRLSGPNSGYDAVLSGYETAKAVIGRSMASAALTDHGKVLNGLDWRIDKVVSSSHGGNTTGDVIFLTMRYVDGTEPGKVTLQVTPDVMRELKLFVDRFQGL